MGCGSAMPETLRAADAAADVRRALSVYRVDGQAPACRKQTSPRSAAAAGAAGGPYSHLLRFVHTNPERKDSGGYPPLIIG